MIVSMGKKKAETDSTSSSLSGLAGGGASRTEAPVEVLPEIPVVEPIVRVSQEMVPVTQVVTEVATWAGSVCHIIPTWVLANHLGSELATSVGGRTTSFLLESQRHNQKQYRVWLRKGKAPQPTSFGNCCKRQSMKYGR